MRKILGLIIVIILAIAILPYAMGVLAQKRIFSLVDQFSTYPKVTMILTAYDRGWFHSTANIKVKMKIDMPSGKYRSRNASLSSLRQISFNVKEKIQHGPILMSNGGVRLGQAIVTSDIVLTPKDQAKLDEMFAQQAQKPALKSRLIIKLFGNVVSTVSISPFSFVGKENAQERFEFQGLNAEWKISSNFKSFNGRVTLLGVDMMSPQFQLQISDLKSNFTRVKNPIGLWTGGGTLSLASFDVREAKAKRVNFSLSGLTVTTKSDIEDKLMNSGLNLGIEKVAVNDATYGPGTFNSTLNNLNAETLVKIIEKIKASNSRRQSMQQRQMMMMTLLPLLPNLMDRGAVYTLEKLNFTVPEGDINASGYAKVHNSKSKSQPKLDFRNFYQRLEARFTFQVPVALTKKMLLGVNMKKVQRQQMMQSLISKRMQERQVQQQQVAQQNGNEPQQVSATPAEQFQPLTQEQMMTLAKQNTDKEIANFLDDGMLIQEGKNYITKIAFIDGKFTVNGHAPNFSRAKK